MRTTVAGTMLACGVAASAAPSQPTPLADIDAVVSQETRQTLASGVTRVDRWKERLVRRGNQVWSERIMPARTAIAPQHDKAQGPHAGHEHFNAETSARWIGVDGGGQPMLKFVDREHRFVVSVPQAEHQTVGFDGRYDAAASIVPPAVVRRMKRLGTASGEAAWYGERGDGWTHRVLWSEARQLALRVESQRDDGSVRRVVDVQLRPGRRVAAPPWNALAGYTAKQYDEFMD